MTESSAQPSREREGRSGSWTRRFRLWFFLWPAVAFCTFAGLQAWRISVFDAIQHEVRPGSRTTVSPQTVSELGSWVLFASNLRAKQGENPLQAFNDVRRVPDQRPMLIVRLLGAGAAMAVTGWAAVCGLLAGLTFVVRWIPRRASPRLRVRIAMGAHGMAWPWGVALGALVGGAFWFVGFDREGWTRPLVDGLAPTLAQTAGMTGAWVVLMVLVSLAFLRPAAAAAEIQEACPRCAYSRAGLPGADCPECGSRLPETADLAAATARSPGACHGTVLRAGAAAMLTGALAVFIVLMAAPGVQGWARLRPANAAWRHLATLEPGAPAQRIDCIYGAVELEAENPAGSWVVRWRFEPSPTRGMAAGSGSWVIADEVLSPGSPAWACEALPFGMLYAGRRATDPGLLVQGPVLIFR